ncbi:MAG: immunoglobulin domain-containing protein [Opitutaceae bacterium]|nr:immunoglobulin domain-containing protein [Opitutaceae bacterium]
MADTELSNSKCGIDLYFGTGYGAEKGTGYYEEYLYHDKLTWDAKVVYIRDTTALEFQYNAQSQSGAGAVVRYKIDRDRQYWFKWADNSRRTETARVLPAYSTPFTLASQNYEAGVPVVGTTGWGSGSLSDPATYHRGVLDSFGDEWHTLAYASDNNAAARLTTPITDQAFYAVDGKTVLLVVNPKTPCFTARAGTGGQFFTTLPKAYWTPKVVAQTTYFSGSCSFELRDIYGRHVSYRINGGSWVPAGASTVTLTDANFTNGTNTLEYRSAGFEANAKTRTIIKNPTHPSLAEPHGDYLWGDTAGYNAMLSRLTRDPYKGEYNKFKTRPDMIGNAAWDAFVGLGLRDKTGQSSYTKPAAKFAIVAKVDGWNYGGVKKHGVYAKEMLIENLCTLDPIGFELSHSSDAVPNRERHYRGYYDSDPFLAGIFAYDILVANFRSDQVTGGITPIEDYFIRDRYASFVYEAMMATAGMWRMGDLGMWAGARVMTAVAIAMIMREYTSPIYGTSGFGTVQTTYPLCPYQTDQLTWKKAMFDNDAPRTAYPNYTYRGQGQGELFSSASLLYGGRSYPEGMWTDKLAYFSTGLMERHLTVWANMAVRYGGGKRDTRFEVALRNCANALMVGTGDPYPQTPQRRPVMLCCNSHWFDVAQTNIPAINALPTTDNRHPGKAIADSSPWAFAWYDDGITGNAIAPAITSQPVGLSIVVGQTAQFTVAASGTAPLAYQWKKDLADITGATSATLTIPNAQLGDAGSYTCVVINDGGSATSSAAVLNVTAPSTPPPSNPQWQRDWQNRG